MDLAIHHLGVHLPDGHQPCSTEHFPERRRRGSGDHACRIALIPLGYPATEQGPTPALPYAPIHVEAWASGRDGLYVRWDPPWWRVGVPDATGYIVQWKKPDDSWSDSAAVSQREIRGGWQGLQEVGGLTEGTLYSVRVFATNAAGDGPPSEDTLGRPQPLNPHLISMSVNGWTLTMRYDRQLDQTSVPAETAFVVLVNGGLRTVSAVAVRGMEVVLTDAGHQRHLPQGLSSELEFA